MLLVDICAAISNGLILTTPTHSVGIYRRNGAWVWACLDSAGKPVVATHDVPVMQFAQGVPYPLDVRFASVRQDVEPDWSAFGAAKVFVSLVGERRAKLALTRARKDAA